MTKETDFMVQSLFQRESMDEMTLDELKRHAEEFPYSSIIQFLYTSKLKSQYHLDFPEAVSKTALFFDDSSWLNYQLREEAEKGSFRKILYDSQFNNISEDEMVAVVEGIKEVEGVEEVEAVEDIDRIEDVDVLEDVDRIEEVEVVDGTKVEFDESATIEPIVADKVQNSEQPPTLQPNTALEIPITPYHTVDYFASLGIKINMEGDKDELSMKVKSFTAWLKTMKRLQPGAETVTIKDIQSILDNHNEKENPTETVFTEAMAEVYLKQGLNEKAIEVYDKLSLQNPLNSHIFADKISKIKENKV